MTRAIVQVQATSFKLGDKVLFDHLDADFIPSHSDWESLTDDILHLDPVNMTPDDLVGLPRDSFTVPHDCIIKEDVIGFEFTSIGGWNVAENGWTDFFTWYCDDVGTLECVERFLGDLVDMCEFGETPSCAFLTLWEGKGHYEYDFEWYFDWDLVGKLDISKLDLALTSN